MSVRSKPMDLDGQFAEGVKRARIAAGMTQEQLTQAMSERGFGFYQATVYKVESGQRRVTVGEALALAEILGASVETLARAVDDSDGERAVLEANVRAITSARQYAEAELDVASVRLAEWRAREAEARVRLAQHRGDPNGVDSSTTN